MCVQARVRAVALTSDVADSSSYSDTFHVFISFLFEGQERGARSPGVEHLLWRAGKTWHDVGLSYETEFIGIR